MIIKYAKGVYLQKVTELESHYNLLSTHLERMNGLKEQMYQFWNDKHARDMAQVLTEEIRKVQTAMDRTRELIGVYKGCIEHLDGSDLSVTDTLQSLLSMLTGSDG